jgi:succinate dehydrogenase hydrophobic anchor subunit
MTVVVPSGSARAYPRGRSRRAWRWTVASGGALVVLVTAHMVAHHFVVDQVGGLRTYEQVLDYIGNPLMLAVECLLLAAVTIHAMLGLRSVFFDFDFSPHARRRIDAALCVLGAATLIYGAVLLAVLASRA